VLVGWGGPQLGPPAPPSRRVRHLLAAAPAGAPRPLGLASPGRSLVPRGSSNRCGGAAFGRPGFESPAGAFRSPGGPRPRARSLWVAAPSLAALAASGPGSPRRALRPCRWARRGGCSSPGAPWGAGGARLRCCAPWAWFLAWLLVPRPPPVAPGSSACLAWAAVQGVGSWGRRRLSVGGPGAAVFCRVCSGPGAAPYGAPVDSLPNCQLVPGLRPVGGLRRPVL